MPSYHGVAPEPVTNAPPWIHTITGRRAVVAAGVHTLRSGSPRSRPGSAPPSSCLHHDVALCGLGRERGWRRARRPTTLATGACHRVAPTGGAASGMPLKTRSRALEPLTLPLRASTIETAVEAPRVVERGAHAEL